MSRAKDRQYKQDELIFNVTEDLVIAMEDAGLTQSDLARALGKSKSYVTQVLSGARNMTLKTLADLCFAIGVEPQVVFTNSEEGVIYDPVNSGIYQPTKDEAHCDNDWHSDNVLPFPSLVRRSKKHIKETAETSIETKHENNWATALA